jgi:hypothetical protein
MTELAIEYKDAPESSPAPWSPPPLDRQGSTGQRHGRSCVADLAVLTAAALLMQ